MNILIIGSSGYLGSHIVHSLLKYSSHDTISIFGLQRRSDHTNLSYLSALPESKKYKQFVGDFFNQAILDKVFKTQYDVIILASGMTDPKKINSYPAESKKSNYDAILHIIKKIRSTQIKFPKVVYLTTQQEYGISQNNLDILETYLRQPHSMYGIHKQKATDMVISLSENFYQPVALIISNVYGFAIGASITESNYNTVHFLTRKALQCGEVVVFGDGKQLRNYLYIEDFLDILFKIIFGSPIHRIYNIGFSGCTPFITLCKTISTLSGAEVKFTEWDDVYKNNEIGDVCLNVSRVMLEFNWKPKYALIKGLKLLIKKMKYEN